MTHWFHWLEAPRSWRRLLHPLLLLRKEVTSFSALPDQLKLPHRPAKKPWKTELLIRLFLSDTPPTSTAAVTDCHSQRLRGVKPRETTPLWVGLFLIRKSFLFSRPIKRWWKPSARFFSHRWSVSGRVTDAFWCYAAYSTVRLLWRPSGGFVCSPPQVWWVSKRGLDSQVDSASPVPQVPPSQQDCWTAARQD